MTIAQGFCLFLITVMAMCIGRDDSDPPGGRSGLSVYVDRKTGCEYLSAGFNLIPRLRADGSHVCSNPTESQP